MNKFSKLSYVALSLALVPMSFSSCATICSGGNPVITIDGDIKEPVNIYTEVDTYTGVTLPAKVLVNRHKLDGQCIRIESDQHKFNDIKLRKILNGYTWGNILLGGIIGLAVDLATNCVAKPLQNTFFIKPINNQTETASDSISSTPIQ